MITVTTLDGKVALVDLQHAWCVLPRESGGSDVCFSFEHILGVQETPEELQELLYEAEGLLAVYQWQDDDEDGAETLTEGEDNGGVAVTVGHDTGDHGPAGSRDAPAMVRVSGVPYKVPVGDIRNPEALGLEPAPGPATRAACPSSAHAFEAEGQGPGRNTRGTPAYPVDPETVIIGDHDD